LNLLPTILPHLTSLSPVLRDATVDALSAFALAALHHPTSPPLALFEHMEAFVNSQTSRRKSADASQRLPAVMEAALVDHSEKQPGTGRAWAVSVLASIVILSGPGLFSQPRLIKLLGRALSALSVDGRGRRIREPQDLARHAGVWRCIIWAFAGLPRRGARTPDETADASADDDRGTRDKAFLFVKSNSGLHTGIGTSLVACLLERCPDEAGCEDADIEKACEVVQDMLQSPNKRTCREGQRVLFHILDGVAPASTEPEWNKPRLVPRTLLVARCLKADDPSRFDEDHVQLEDVRKLEQSEVAIGWAALIRLWTTCVQSSFSTGKALSVRCHSLMRGLC
jgi:hypothetical protein